MKGFIGITRFAEILGVSYQTVIRWGEAGRFQLQDIAGLGTARAKWVIEIEEAKRFVKECGGNPKEVK